MLSIRGWRRSTRRMILAAVIGWLAGVAGVSHAMRHVMTSAQEEDSSERCRVCGYANDPDRQSCYQCRSREWHSGEDANGGVMNDHLVVWKKGFHEHDGYDVEAGYSLTIEPGSLVKGLGAYVNYLTFHEGIAAFASVQFKDTDVSLEGATGRFAQCTFERGGVSSSRAGATRTIAFSRCRFSDSDLRFNGYRVHIQDCRYEYNDTVLQIQNAPQVRLSQNFFHEGFLGFHNSADVRIRDCNFEQARTDVTSCTLVKIEHNSFRLGGDFQILYAMILTDNDMARVENNYFGAEGTSGSTSAESGISGVRYKKAVTFELNRNRIAGLKFGVQIGGALGGKPIVARLNGNRMHNNFMGVSASLFGATSCTLRNNCISGNAQGISAAFLDDSIVDARHNNWNDDGSCSGPWSDSNMQGTGNLAIGPVEFKPWLCACGEGDDCAPDVGFDDPLLEDVPYQDGIFTGSPDPNDPNPDFTASDLSRWIREAAGVNGIGRITVVVNTCHAGAHMNALRGLPKAVVIGSTGASSFSFYDQKGIVPVGTKLSQALLQPPILDKLRNGGWAEALQAIDEQMARDRQDPQYLTTDGLNKCGEKLLDPALKSHHAVVYCTRPPTADEPNAQVKAAVEAHNWSRILGGYDATILVQEHHTQLRDAIRNMAAKLNGEEELLVVVNAHGGPIAQGPPNPTAVAGAGAKASKSAPTLQWASSLSLEFRDQALAAGMEPFFVVQSREVASTQSIEVVLHTGAGPTSLGRLPNSSNEPMTASFKFPFELLRDDGATTYSLQFPGLAESSQIVGVGACPGITREATLEDVGFETSVRRWPEWK